MLTLYLAVVCIKFVRRQVKSIAHPDDNQRGGKKSCGEFAFKGTEHGVNISELHSCLPLPS